VSLAEVFQRADGTLDADVYQLIRELVATGDRSMIAPARAALERYTAERNWYGRDLMAHVLAGLAGTEVFPRLLDLYADAMRRDDGDDWDFLGQALCTVMRADPAGCRVVVLPLVTDHDQHVRRAALWAIGYVFEPSDMAMLRAALADPERSAPPEVVDHLIPLISEPAFHARSALGEAIGRRAANSDRIPAAAAALRQLLADPEPSVRTGAIRGIGLLGEPLAAVEPFAGDPDWRVRSAVADVLRLT